jgi:phage protein D
VTAASRSAPGVRITVLPDPRAREGEPLHLGDRILSFSFEDAERRADKASLQLDNHDLSLFEREELMGGRILEVSWGYPDRMSRPRRLVVRSVKGFETLTIEARALSVLMDRQARTRSWHGMSRARVARLVAEEHGYDIDNLDVEETEEVFDTIAQAGETDARFLRRLASREEFEMYVDGSGFHFHQRRQSDAPSHVFTWYADPGRGDLMSVSVESDLVRRVGRVSVRGRDPLNRTTIEASANNETAERVTLAELTDSIDPETGATTTVERSAVQELNATASVRPTTAPAASQARREAQARFRRAERATVKLTLKAVGDPSFASKSVVAVRGISRLLSGLYYVTSVKHTIDGSGYVCELKATRDGTGRRARALAGAHRDGAGPSEPGGGDQRPELGGERNRARESGGAPPVVERIDGETGETTYEFPRGRRASSDPEARR